MSEVKRKIDESGVWFDLEFDQIFFVAERTVPQEDGNYSKKLVAWRWTDTGCDPMGEASHLPQTQWLKVVNPGPSLPALQAEVERLRGAVEYAARILRSYGSLEIYATEVERIATAALTPTPTAGKEVRDG